MKKEKSIIINIRYFLIGSRVKAEELNFAPSAKSAILIDADTGTIIYEKNSHERLEPASMTKMISMLLTKKLIKNFPIFYKWWDELKHFF